MPNVKLESLRKLMATKGIDAYVVYHNDAHSSEYIEEYDERVKFISGFAGSNAVCVITQTKALCWTDGRYYLAAVKELEEGWELMKMEANLINYRTWLKENLTTGQKVGIDPQLTPISVGENLKETCTTLEITSISENLVDTVWGINHPLSSLKPVIVHEEKYTGMCVKSKLDMFKEYMNKEKGNHLIMTTLDDIAWTLSMRGSDIEYNPLFKSYLILSVKENAVVPMLFSDMSKFASVKDHLVSNQIQLSNYQDVWEAIPKLEGDILLDKDDCNTRILETLTSSKRQIKYVKDTISSIKCPKNPVEIKGFIDCHVEDGKNLVKYLAWIENEVAVNNKVINEYDAALKLEEFRKQGKFYVGLSFETISSSGANASDIHYAPSKIKAKVVASNEIYLVDSGCQYLNGTTDVTRTVHFGKPLDIESEMYTRVLMGNIDLENAVYPVNSLPDSTSLDFLARRYLYDVGKDFKHGTGHGVGHFLCVHEGPVGIGKRSGVPKYNYVFTDEPGYYDDNKFGIRIENVLISKKHPQYDGFVAFENITMAPYCSKLIVKSMLTIKQLQTINSYHKLVYATLSPLLKDDALTLKYLERECKEI